MSRGHIAAWGGLALVVALLPIGIAYQVAAGAVRRMRGGLVVSVLLVASVIAGCGGPPQAVQTSLTSTARGLVQVDADLAPAYARAADECRESSDDWAAYDDCLETWTIAVDALEVAHRSLLAAQSARDAWDAGSDDGAAWTAAVPCLAAALVHTLDAIAAAGVETPDVLATAVELVRAFGGQCNG